MLVAGLRPATTYSFSVQAINDNGWSEPVSITARTNDASPAGPPAPVVVDNAGTLIWPEINGTNTDESFDADLDARTIQQVLPGRWPATAILVSNKGKFLERSSRMFTNADQLARGKVTYRSPSVKSARIVFNRVMKSYKLLVVLKPKRVSGSVIVTVAAPPKTVNGVMYEPLNASKRFTVVNKGFKRR
jgi:hypothetical protein